MTPNTAKIAEKREKGKEARAREKKVATFFFLTCENAKRNERVIGDDGKFAHSLAPDVNFSW